MLQIRVHREALALTRTELSHKMGVTTAAVSKWESGKNAPRFKRLAQLAELFGCTIDELTRDSA